ncbi:MAG: hypothetical protein Roseis2KO_52630 [Roseivirga sp.]
MTIEEIKNLDEAQDKVEFKEAKTQYQYNKERRSVLGYVVALANEGGGRLIFGVKEQKPGPHLIVGSKAWEGEEKPLEQKIYSDLRIRVSTEVLHEGSNRVLVVQIPSRPVGRYYTFQDVPLMRVGDTLSVMSQDLQRNILNEQEGDFSATICKGLTLADLDEGAVATMKQKYAQKQKNKAFTSQSDEQSLTDLDLLQNGQLTYAALILLGKKEKIREYLPQCAIRLEYRDNPNSIQFDKREDFVDPYFVLIEDLWRIIDVRNKLKHIQLDAYIVDIPELNDQVIRESINNAVAHRDYKINSEIVIKQSRTQFTVQSHGGFPLGVSIENVLTTNSTPRNRLLADVLTKTGLVERSGQGVDKIFRYSLSEGKSFPDYGDSDMLQVTLSIPIEVLHPVFALFVREIEQKIEQEDQMLNVDDVIALVKVREGELLGNKELASITKLETLKAIKATTEVGKYVLGQRYNELINAKEGSERQQIVDFVSASGEVKIGEIVALFENRLTRRQVTNMVYNLVSQNILATTGRGQATRYVIKSF